MLDVKLIKRDFPIFTHQPDLVYLDSGATSLKPQIVLDRMMEYYTRYSANIHRGIYKMSEKATSEYEKTRESLAKFINANRQEEIVFTKNTTESINLVAYALGREIVDEGDEVVVTVMEHHSNFVPWQQLAFELGATFKVIEVKKDGTLDLPYDSDGSIDLTDVITKNTKIFAFTHVSNTLGTINPVKKIIAAAKKINPHVVTVVDAAQAAPHMAVDVQDLGCDFLAFSSHKMLDPTGVGVLWGKYELLDGMFPFMYGGDMIQEVAIEKTTFKKPPGKFEAGTPHIAGVIGMRAGMEYLENLGWNEIRQHEKELTEYAFKSLQSEFGKEIQILGPQDLSQRAGIVAFKYGHYHPHDIAQILDENHIAIRAGHHCTMPLHTQLQINASARASFYIYNDNSDVDKLTEGLKKVMLTLG